ncbi:FAD-binding oxidoreductase [Paraburkholderia edwinii]|uniref:FAD-binding oxidoreductase n=1 Tax=Paraburkholderia edwinii TaxID=2861782 RepID=A0ABX8UVG9_9BURK|nr:FAD-binding oxidoreductase [Paraburkholderia edwinii]QYD72646.1 FAD-binding oxidoreductase [Paraburkholderia edwinii]
MHSATLKRRDGTPIDTTAIDIFRNNFAGQIFSAGDAGYDKARRIWNASIDKYPGLIARCSGVNDVIRAVKFARANDVLVSIKGGGHNVAGRALCDDGIVIDLSAMNRVTVDVQTRKVHVQGGALLENLDTETQRHGLAVPAGVVPKTGIAGLTLGGGVGWLVRKYGLTIDNLESCEVVTAEGDLVTANDHSNPDLFWALRGGGGNFGVVTSFSFRAHPVRTVLGGQLLWPRSEARAIMHLYRSFITTAPEEMTAYAGIITTPDGEPVSALYICWCGDIAEGERVIEPLRRFGTPIRDTVEPIPFLAMQGLAGRSYPDDMHNYWKSTFLTAFSDEAIDVLVEQGTQMKSPLSSLLVEYYAGAPTRVGQADTAFGQRNALYNIGISGQWPDPKESDQHIGWVRATSDALQPYSTGDYLLNFTSDEVLDRTKAAFGDNYARLAEVKAKYDPTNFFSLNQNIKPAH